MGIKFVVDLSPPEEGDEAVDVVERLWCPDSVISWRSKLEGNYLEPDEDDDPPSTSQRSTHRPQSLDICLDSDTRNPNLGWNHWPNSPPGLHPFDELPKPKPKPTPASYSPTRHTAAIERVLHILHGLDPQIHTTPMWYTVHKVALQLECTASVQDHIISWLYGNLDFIERYPGLVLEIASELKNPTLFRDAFAILVGTQLLGGRIGPAAVFTPISAESYVPPEAAPWQKHIVFARKSLQARLERLYAYISSTEWLDNAVVIPEYAKLTAPLTSPTTPECLRRACTNADMAIRTAVTVALGNLFAFSEDPGNPGWMNPWEKGVFDLIPREKQVYCRMYWKQLRNLTRRPPVEMFGAEVIKQLWAWEMAMMRASQEARESKVMAQMLQTVRTVGKTMCTAVQTHTSGQSVLEVRSRTPASHTTTEKWRKDPPAQRWKRMSSQLKEILGSTPSSSRQAGESADCSGVTLLESPPDYDEVEGTLPCYDEYPGKTEVRTEMQETGTSLLIPLRKRKSMGDGVGSRGNSGEDEKTDLDFTSADRRGDDCMGTARPTPPRAERIEILNPIAKRRRSVERSREGDDDDTEASFYTQVDQEESMAGEPEMFKISGVYDETAVRQTGVVKGKGKAVERTDTIWPRESGAKWTLEELIERVMADDEEAKEAPTSPVDDKANQSQTAYWSSENVRARAMQARDKGKGKSTTLNPETSVYEPHDLLHDEAGSPPSYVPDHLSLPTIEGPEENLYDPYWLADAIAQEFDAIVQEPTAREQLCWAAPLTLHTFNTPCPYTSIEDTCPPLLSNELKINTDVLWSQCLAYLRAVGAEALKVPISFEPTQAGDGQVLVCLREEEWRFMPLWAGGLEDGSGGVFGEFVEPLSEVGGVITGVKAEVQDDGEETEVESLVGSYDDCMDLESMGSFETSGFSDLGSVDGGTVLSESEFGDSDAGREGDSDVETREESEVESLGDSTEGESGSEGTDEFEDIGWEST